jgi:hypothetical protein
MRENENNIAFSVLAFRFQPSRFSIRLCLLFWLNIRPIWQRRSNLVDLPELPGEA